MSARLRGRGRPRHTLLRGFGEDGGVGYSGGSGVDGENWVAVPEPLVTAGLGLEKVPPAPPSPKVWLDAKSCTVCASSFRKGLFNAAREGLFRPQVTVKSICPTFPHGNDKFRRKAMRNPFYRPIKKQVRLRLDADVLACPGKQGKGYQTRANSPLREIMGKER